MNSETSTDPARAGAAPLQPRHVFLLLSMLAATAAVMITGKAHPIALILLSVTVVAAGLVGLALQGALSGFFGLSRQQAEPLGSRAVDELRREKALALRSIKELEFDRAMGKISEKDYADLSGGLRARAMGLMEELDRAEAAKPPASGSAPAAPKVTRSPGACGKCGTANDSDAKFCKSCGERL